MPSRPVGVLPCLALAGASGACLPSSHVSGEDPGAGGPTVPPAIDVTFEQVLDAFPDAGPIPTPTEVFGLILGDLDLDGDLDCIVNRHNKVRMRIYENVGAEFRLLNPQGLDRSGVYENAGIPDLLGDPDDVVPMIEAGAEAGFYVWHDPVKVKGRWYFYLWPDGDATPMPARLNFNNTIQNVNMDAGDFTWVDEFTIDVDLQDPTVPTFFSVRAKGNQLRLERTGSLTAPWVVGSSLVPIANDARLPLWKRDPHGVALVDVVGSPCPDLYLTHGGITGNLHPPHDPKVDQLFEHLGASTLYAELARGKIPASYGRGRQVAWCDVDGDGDLELYTGNRETPNTLLDADGAGGWVDVAPALGIDLEHGASFAWTDLDDDGLLDLLFVELQTLRVAYNRPTGFVLAEGAELGLVLPDVEGGHETLFDPTTLQLVDVDRDGDLDLWVSAYDPSERARLFRRGPGGFTDASDATGVAGVPAFSRPFVADVDNDGWIDVLTPVVEVDPDGDDGGPGTGTKVTHLDWWRNLGGEAFERARLSDDFAKEPSTSLTGGDVDGDGWLDLVVMTDDDRQLLLNRSVGGNTLLVVHPDLPLGSVVRAYYADGSAQAQQWGAATVSRHSQSLQPLRFGMGPDDAILELGVQLPGDAGESYRVPVPDGATDLEL